MGNKGKTEEQIKTEIFNVYLRCRDELSSDRRQVYFGQFCGFIFQWCTNYILFETKEMGVEIVEALERIVKGEKNTKVPKEEKDFFKYLKTALYNARTEYYRNNKPDIIRLPRILKRMEDIITMQESYAGKKLSEEEKLQCISKWFDKPEEKARKYLEFMNVTNVGRLEHYIDGEEVDILESEDLKPPYMPNSYDEPESIFLSKLNASMILDAVESALRNNTQAKTRNCYRALFTAYCINKLRDFNDLIPVLDSEIMEEYRENGKKPEQYEIYLKYYPGRKKDSAAVRASEMNKKFLGNLYTFLKEKNPEIFL